MKLGILDQGEGLYKNPRSGKTTPLHEAIDRGDVKVELGELSEFSLLRPKDKLFLCEMPIDMARSLRVCR